MEQQHRTIGLAELLDEVTRDLSELRSKHASDYSLKNVTMWWELEKERLVMRHSPATIVWRKARVVKRLTIGFLAGAMTALAVNAAIGTMIR